MAACSASSCARRFWWPTLGPVPGRLSSKGAPEIPARSSLASGLNRLSRSLANALAPGADIASAPGSFTEIRASCDTAHELLNDLLEAKRIMPTEFRTLQTAIVFVLSFLPPVDPDP